VRLRLGAEPDSDEFTDAEATVVSGRSCTAARARHRRQHGPAFRFVDTWSVFRRFDNGSCGLPRDRVGIARYDTAKSSAAPARPRQPRLSSGRWRDEHHVHRHLLRRGGSSTGLVNAGLS